MMRLIDDLNGNFHLNKSFNTELFSLAKIAKSYQTAAYFFIFYATYLQKPRGFYPIAIFYPSFFTTFAKIDDTNPL